eukprot:1329837-Rhodomonas_salina.2
MSDAEAECPGTPLEGEGEEKGEKKGEGERDMNTSVATPESAGSSSRKWQPTRTTWIDASAKLSEESEEGIPVFDGGGEKKEEKAGGEEKDEDEGPPTLETSQDVDESGELSNAVSSVYPTHP